MSGTTKEAGEPVGKAGGWKRVTAVHLAMIVAALIGIAWTSAADPGAAGATPGAPRGVTWVWLALVPVYCAACIWHGWDWATANRLRMRLVVTQALHWLAFLGAMYMVLSPTVSGMMNADAIGLVLLTLLAMGTFVAGVHAWSAAICATGVTLALAIPVISWLDRSIVLVVASIAVVAVVAGWVMLRRLRRPAPSASPSALTP